MGIRSAFVIQLVDNQPNFSFPTAVQLQLNFSNL